MSGFLDDLEFELAPGHDLVVVLTSRLRYQDRKGRVFTVPKRFRCDLASVPKLLRSVSTPWQVSARAGVLHDCGYRWFEVWKIPRREMDEVYRQALRDDQAEANEAEPAGNWFTRGWRRVSQPTRAWIQKAGVRLGAWRAWRRWRSTPKKQKGIKPPMWVRV